MLIECFAIVKMRFADIWPIDVMVFWYVVSLNEGMTGPDMVELIAKSATAFVATNTHPGTTTGAMFSAS